MTWTPWRARLFVAGLAFLAYIPSLGGGFLELDDLRFVRDNEAVHSITPLRVFTNPETMATEGWEGTYRPLRTLDFSLDWVLGGGRAWFFHLRNVIYHMLGSLLVLALFRRLAKRAALTGALVFALHPVGTEAVAWITSRADLLVLCLFVGALVLHCDGRRRATGVVLLAALLAKESAVVFPAVVFAVDRFRRETPRWSWYGAYGGLVLAYVLVRHLLLGTAGHLGGEWWGGSYAANLTTMARGALGYAQVLLFPVGQTIDYHVPAMSGLDIGAILGMAVVGGAVLAAVVGGREVRLALAWFAFTILPMSNILFAVGIPTAERFLYVPLVGFALAVGHLLASIRLRWVVLACLLVLTLSRGVVWRETDVLFAANRGVSTPRTLDHRAVRALERAHEAAKKHDRSRLEAEAAEVFGATDEVLRLYREEIGLSPGNVGARLLRRKANVLLLLDRHADALAAAKEALRLHVEPYALYNAAVACVHLDRAEEAANYFEQAIHAGYTDRDLRPTAVGILNLVARGLAGQGQAEEALGLYRRSWALISDPVRNAEAHDMLRRLGGSR
jgi:protein O-mannosyl-transferase